MSHEQSFIIVKLVFASSVKISSSFFVFIRTCALDWKSKRRSLRNLSIRNIHRSCSTANNNMTKIISTIDDKTRRWRVHVWRKKMYKCKLWYYYYYFFSIGLNKRINTFLLLFYKIFSGNIQVVIKQDNANKSRIENNIFC